jgi:hypothetical protein
VVQPGIIELVPEEPVALGGDRSEQSGLITEVVGRGGVRHTGSASHGPHAHRTRTQFADRLNRCIDERSTQVTVMVRTLV